MIEKLKEINLHLVIGFALTGMSHALASNFLPEYLKENLITLLVALLAINTTTSSVVMTKLKEISDAKGGNFSATIDQLKHSIYEQVIFVVLGAILLTLSGSKLILELHVWSPFILDGLVASVFVAALYTLFDTAKSIFVILRYEDREK